MKDAKNVMGSSMSMEEEGEAMSEGEGGSDDKWRLSKEKGCD